MSLDPRPVIAVDPVVTCRVLGPDGPVRDYPTVTEAQAAAPRLAPGDDGPAAVVWVDLVAPDADMLDRVAKELGEGLDLHPLLIEDVFDTSRRAKINRFDDHVFLDLVDVAALGADQLGDQPLRRHHAVELTGGEVLVVGAVSAIVHAHRVITIRTRDDTLDSQRIADEWTVAEPGRRDGPGLVIHGMLDQVVDRIVSVSALLDADVDELEQEVIEHGVARSSIQSRAFTLRKATALVRRVALPTREVVDQVLRRDGRGFLSAHISDDNVPYLHDVGDHVVRVSESLDALRDELTSVLEFNMSLQDNELNQVMKKLSAWAAIVAVPTAVTGYFGQNIPYPGFSEQWGFWLSMATILVGAVGLWWLFRRLDWL